MTDQDDDAVTRIRGGAPLKVTSMKSPAAIAPTPPNVTPELQRPQLRAMPHRQPTPPSGNLAPPRAEPDGRKAPPRAHAIPPIAWAAMLAIAVGVGLAIWLVATR